LSTALIICKEIIDITKMEDDPIILTNGVGEEDALNCSRRLIVEEELLTIDIDKFIEEYSNKYDVGN
jgi:hypothetical protein